MLLPLIVFASMSGAMAVRPCGGAQNKYVCHPSNPRQFQICIGDQQYTMKCPGSLHFSTKTQTCDWPRNANCGRTRVKVVTQSPRHPQNQWSQRRYGGTGKGHQRPTQRRQQQQRPQRQRQQQPPYTWGRNPYAKDAKKKPVNAVAALTGPRKYRNPSDREKNVADDLYNYTKSQDKTQSRGLRVVSGNMTGNTNQSRDKWSLAHYPWWAAKSATPANIRARLSRRPVTPTPEHRRSMSPFTPRSRTPKKRIRYKPISMGRTAINSAASGKYRLKPIPTSRNYRPKPVSASRRYRPKPVTASRRYRPKAAAKKSRRPPLQNDASVNSKSHRKKTIIRKPGKCDPSTCKLPDCRCIGNDIPGGIPVTQTPMMVMLTFDDSVNIANFDYYAKLFDGKFRNPNGCKVKGTFFVSGDSTQYHLVEELYKNGLEIASHSLSHRSPTTWWARAGYQGYVHEIEGMRKRLSRQSHIPKEEIKGMRVPFLQVGGDDQYKMLHDYDYTYDTSMVTGHLYRNEKPPMWPFTLDYPPDSKTCSLTPCPQGSYPGLWEVPLVRWYGSNKMACAMPDGCVIGAGRKGTLKYIHDNFNRHYTTNRSPLGIFIHASWFRRKSGNFEGLMDFFRELSRMNDVWILSVSQVLDWIRDPKTLSQVNSIPSWSC